MSSLFYNCRLAHIKFECKKKHQAVKHNSKSGLNPKFLISSRLVACFALRKRKYVVKIGMSKVKLGGCRTSGISGQKLIWYQSSLGF